MSHKLSPSEYPETSGKSGITIKVEARKKPGRDFYPPSGFKAKPTTEEETYPVDEDRFGTKSYTGAGKNYLEKQKK